MKRKRRPPPPVHHDRWLVSYADFITLLFAFFVVLYAAAEIDKKKVGRLAESMQSAFGEIGALPPPSISLQPHAPVLPQVNPSAPPGPDQDRPDRDREDLGELRRLLEKALAPEIARGEVAVHVGSEGLVVSLRELGFFDSGSADIQARSLAALGRMAALLVERRCRVRIEGHTDNIPIHNPHYSSNWELSTARATEMVRLLMTRYQMTPDQLSATGYAQFHPTAGNDSAEGRAKNRRVDLVILGKLRTEDKPGAALPLKPSPQRQ